MEKKEEIIRKHIKGIISIETITGVIYVTTKNCFIRTSVLEFIKERIGYSEVTVAVKNQDGLLTYIFE